MPTVLIIDDEDLDRKVLHSILLSAGYEVVGTARSGEEGINLCKTLRPDLITIDLMMPKMNGIEVLIRLMKENDKTNALICTSAHSDPVVDLAIRYGAKGYIIKPFQAKSLLATVKQVIGAPDPARVNVWNF
ncbi:MAG TPA: response regulator [Methanospirillum sp.]|uniref:response regulator n=1 Tax=Methanospirillum sp. TaxID=45200 RepID=UPI002B53FF2B|nr:response regulator [Methanospirillum sp.]HOJ95786.1 response regulator [Methanospirillum sp.]HOL40924.1 response regulator [Methanospirillum sp.]HPP77145.1 response regulator [Methanospirillum sp.]